MLYEWLRDHGNLIAAVVGIVCGWLGWQLKREREHDKEWRMSIEARMESLAKVADMEKELARLERLHGTQIAALKERLDRADRHLDRRLAELQQALRDQTLQIREDLQQLAGRIETAVGHKSGATRK